MHDKKHNLIYCWLLDITLFSENDLLNALHGTFVAWWPHQMETISALLALCAGHSPVTGEFPTQRPVTRRFDVFFDLRLNKRISKQSWGWWFETPSQSLWRHCNGHECRTWATLIQYYKAWVEPPTNDLQLESSWRITIQPGAIP